MILTIAIGKGGTGKTSTAAALANLAREDGKAVLAVDVDPQANFTAALGGDPRAFGLDALLTDQAQAADVIQETPQAHLIPAGPQLSSVIQAVQDRPGRDFILREALKPVLGRYDVIILDTAPAINTLAVNALAAADRVLLPMQANLFCAMGLAQMGDTIAQVRRYCNPALTVAGVLLTRHNPRSALARDLVPELRQQAEAMGTRLFTAYIRQAAAVEQAQILQQSLFDYAPSSTAAADYRALYKELEL